MAHIKLGSAKYANGSINYANSKAVKRSGVNCDPNYTKAQFEVTRRLYGKNDGIQAHTVIQSFSPGEVTPEQANELGRALAEQIAAGYEVAIYTHADKDHVHNHIIINSVHPDTGRKYHCHGWEGLQEVRHQSNLISAEHGLTIPYLPEEQRIYGENVQYSDPAPIRHSQAEQAIIEQGKDSWKDEIRQAIDIERQKANTYEEFKINLKREYDITTKDSGKHIVFTHPERVGEHDKGRIRGFKLGENYTKEGIQNGIERHNTRQKERSNYENRALNSLRRNIDSVGDGKAERQRREQEAVRRITEKRQRTDAKCECLAKQQHKSNNRPKKRSIDRGR